MNKIKHLTDKERQQYSNVYSNLIMSMEEIKSFIDPDTLRKRPYYNKISKLKQYLEALDEADYKSEGKGILEIFKNDMVHMDEVYKLKHSLKTDLDKLINCSKCKCSKCFKDCAYKSCIKCEPSQFVLDCADNYMLFSDTTTRTLFDNDNRRDVTFKTEGILYNLQLNKYYILLVDISNPNNQHLLEYKQLLNGNEDFGQLDKNTLDTIYEIFVNFGVSV